MNWKQEALAAIVRIIASETSLIHKPSPFEELLTDMFGMESYDKKAAREIEAEATRVVEAAKRANTNRKFKKLTKNF